MVTRADIIAVVIGLLAGYLLVSWVIRRLNSNGPKTSTHTEHPGSAQGSKESHRTSTDESTCTPRPWYEVLGVPTYASLDQIKLAYRRKIAQYHPDKTSGLGSELRALAEAKTKELNTAYDAALRAFSK